LKQWAIGALLLIVSAVALVKQFSRTR